MKADLQPGQIWAPHSWRLRGEPSRVRLLEIVAAYPETVTYRVVSDTYTGPGSKKANNVTRPTFLKSHRLYQDVS